MDIHVYRDREGWHAKSQVELPNGRVLKIRTEKRSGACLLSTASVWTPAADGFLKHALFGDYNAALEISRPKRTTDKVVREQHERVISQIDTICSTVEQFYALQAASSTIEV